MSPIRARPSRSFLRALVVVGVCLPLGAHSTPRHGYLDELARLVSAGGTRVAPRLSVSPPGPGARNLEPSRELMEYEARVYGRLRAGGGGEALHAAALVALMWADSSAERAARADSAIAYLQAALDLIGPSASLLADLAAAHLVRADRPGHAEDLLLALDAADSALSLDPANPVARYNLALALDRLALDFAARREWRKFLAVDPASAWGARAAARLRAPGTDAPRLPRPRPGADAEWVNLALREPQRARMLAMDTLLGEWGQAVLRGDSAVANDRLRSATNIADGLSRRRGDQSVGSMVQAIQVAKRRGPPALRRLAGAHAEYAGAKAQLDRRSNDSASAAFEHVSKVAGASPLLAQWATYSRAVAEFYAQRLEASGALVERASVMTDTAKYPVLAGRERWSAGTLALRSGSYPTAHDHFESAQRLFERADERENRGAVFGHQTEALFNLGDYDGGFETMRTAFRLLVPSGRSLALHNLLYVTSQAAGARGMWRAARLLGDIDVEVASGVKASVRAEALLVRALDLGLRGETDRAAEDVAAARPIVSSLASGDGRGWHENDLRLAQAAIDLRTRPRIAARELDAVVDTFAASQTAVRLLPALMLRARARLTAGDAGGTVADLDSAAAVLGTLGARAEDANVRARMLDAGRDVFDQLALLHAQAGRVGEALRAVERGRVAFSPTGPARGEARVTAPAAPPGETVVDYALVGDTLLAFVLTGTTLRLRVQPVEADGLALQAAALRSAMEARLPADSLRGRLEELYDVLVLPIRDVIPADARLVVVADGDLASVPFAALRDPRGGRYLVEDHTIRYTATVADASRAPPPARRGPAVFVADPAFSRDENQWLPRLPRLADTTASIARRFPGARVLHDSAATVAAVRSALAGAGLFNFSGHAVFDDDRPSQSYLLLAGRGESSRITAEEIDTLELRGLPLAVLAACETQRSLSGRSGGFAGLSGAMLAAGVGGVLGSLWHVGERRSAALLSEFYRGYAVSRNGPEALQRAQVKLLHSGNPALSSPSAWAGFRFAGR